MDLELIENWREVVAPDDDVYFLGDFTLDFKRVRQVLPLLSGRIHLVAGNHDLCHSSHKDASAYVRHYLQAGFADVCESLSLQIADDSVLCHHMPYFDLDDIDQRYPEHKPQDEGSWLLHGHVHQRWKVSGRQINVGVDVWDFYPVSLSQIEAIVRGNAL